MSYSANLHVLATLTPLQRRFHRDHKGRTSRVKYSSKVPRLNTRVAIVKAMGHQKHGPTLVQLQHLDNYVSIRMNNTNNSVKDQGILIILLNRRHPRRTNRRVTHPHNTRPHQNTTKSSRARVLLVVHRSALHVQLPVNINQLTRSGHSHTFRRRNNTNRLVNPRHPVR